MVFSLSLWDINLFFEVIKIFIRRMIFLFTIVIERTIQNVLTFKQCTYSAIVNCVFDVHLSDKSQLLRYLKFSSIKFRGSEVLISAFKDQIID